MRKIYDILNLNDATQIHTLLTARKSGFYDHLHELEEQWDASRHKVFDEQYRKRKKIKVPSGKKDPTTGKDIYKDDYVERVRIAIPAQKSIVNMSVGFLMSNPVMYKATSHGVDIKKLDNKQQLLFDAIKHCYHDNKIKSFDKELARTVARQCEAAELWYMTTDENGRLGGEIRVRLLAPFKGDKLYPHFNDYDKMDGFGREYRIYDELGTSELHFDVYTDKYVYQYVNGANGWALVNAKAHGFTKIPVVYYRQEKPEWADVQWAIERVEDCISNWGDTNDYFGTPKYFVKGNLKGFAEKGEQGTVFVGGENAAMNVLSWDSSPESVKGEIAYLFNIIYTFTQTADISFENMKTLGNNTSGAAIRLMFTAPHMNANLKTEMYGEMFTRRSNIVANGICHTGLYASGISESVAENMDFEPIFTPYIPKNDTELLQLITQSSGGKQSTSQRRAIELNPLNDDPDKIEEEINKEQEGSLAQQALLLGNGGAATGEQSIEDNTEDSEGQNEITEKKEE
jgi:SPP1 family phage portal protein